MDKLLVTNRTALKAKYGAAGFAAIQDAIRDMIAADKERGLTSTLLLLDDSTAMKKMTLPVVKKRASAYQAKRAIDGAYKKLRPDYLVILGAPDVVPHVLLRDATKHDRDIPSDLPYACSAGYSLQPERFFNPSRVVGRLPDVTGGTSPQDFVRVIKSTASWQSRPRKDYEEYFGLSARVWQQSTEESLDNTFGGHGRLDTSPPKKDTAWTKNQLAPRSHFINCHGAVADPTFYGDGRGAQPPTFAADTLHGKVSAGTVASMECCYGAMLYDPALSMDPRQHPIPNTYLENGAYGYVGSSAIAYGPAAGNSCADLICQYFLKHVLAGASTGRALLEARLTYASQMSQLDPLDVKTLAEFMLIGDPSVHPVTKTETAKALSRAKALPVALPKDRAERRVRLDLLAEEVKRSVAWAFVAPGSKRKPTVESALAGIAETLDLGHHSVETFETKAPPLRARLLTAVKAVKRISGVIDRFHLLTSGPAVSSKGNGGASPAWPKGVASRALLKGDGASRALPKGPITARVVLVRERGGEVVDYEEMFIR